MYVCICTSFFFHFSIDGQLDHFHIFVIVNNVLMNMGCI